MRRRTSRAAPTPGFSNRRGCAPGEDRRCWTVPTDPARLRPSRRRARSAAPRRASGGGARRRASPRDGRRWSARAFPIRAGSERRTFRCVRRSRRRARDGSRPPRPSGEATTRPRKGFSSEPIRARAGRGARRGEREGERRHPPNRRRRGGRSSWEPPWLSYLICGGDPIAPVLSRTLDIASGRARWAVWPQLRVITCGRKQSPIYLEG